MELENCRAIDCSALLRTLTTVFFIADFRGMDTGAVAGVVFLRRCLGGAEVGIGLTV